MERYQQTPEKELDALRRRVAYLEEEVKRLSTLLAVGHAISSELDIHHLLDLIMQEITRALRADRSSLFLVDWDSMELWSSVAQGSDEIRFSIKKGIAGYVALSGETLLVDNAYEDHRFNPEVDNLTGYCTRSVLAMPIRNRRGDIIGVIQVLNKSEGGFTVEDKHLLQALGAQVAIALENAHLYTELKRTFDSFVQTLAATIDAKHHNTSGHSARVRKYSLAVAEEMGLPEDEKELIAYAAILHDLGKIGIDDRILKKPGRLTDEEYAEMQRHPLHTRRILDQIHLPYKQKHLSVLASAHHERLDGTGYPERLRGDQIHLITRIIAVADVFDALTYWREYRDPIDGEKALEVLKQEAGTKLDRRVVEVFEAYYHRERLGHLLAQKRQEAD